MLQYSIKTGVITDTKYDYTAWIVNNNRHIVFAISITAFLITSEIMETIYFRYILLAHIVVHGFCMFDMYH